MKFLNLMLIFALAAAILAGCGGQDVATSGVGQALGATPEPGTYTSAVLGTGYEGALPASSQLAMGTLELESSENTVTPEQAQALLPLWRAIQGGTLQSDAETNAVLAQIEKAMTAEQLAAIAAMQLGMEDMGAWLQEQGINLAPPANGAAGDGGFAPPDGMSQEEAAAMRATAQAGGGPGEGGFPGGESPGTGGPGEGGPFSSMSEEERAAMRATAEAGGLTLGGGRGPAGARGGQLTAMAAPVVELLTARAAQ